MCTSTSTNPQLVVRVGSRRRGVGAGRRYAGTFHGLATRRPENLNRY